MQHIQEIGRQHPYAAPVPQPMNTQQSFSRPPVMGQQNLPGTQMHSPLLPNQTMDHSQITSPLVSQGVPASQMSPRLPIDPHGQSHGQPTAGYQTQVINPPSTSLPQSGVGHYNSAPPLPSQTIASPGLPQYEPRQYPPPPLTTTGQPIASLPGPSLAQVRQKYLQTAPPMPGQTMPNAAGPNLPQAGQRQYGSAPPLPGQPLSSPSGLNRGPAGLPPNYQQPTYQQQPGYPNQMDMYNNQRSPYQGGATASPTGYQSGLQPQQARRLDPEQMPSPIQVMQDDQSTRGGVFTTNQRGLVPPLVTTNFVTQDQGNASPRYIRSTMYTVPITADIIKQTNVPFGLVISPMARTVPGECEPPIVDMGEIGPVRCIRCKAYMCPFMQFVDAGRRFQCMFCKATTEGKN
ncbi:hypothetical protein DMN91_009420 [Ooceraea biroi]|uniref:Zinc finger Sec23/Sec24-type domain-containing protein n=1 Tax=Ooceraea biroi TaxID=2015173 RepID=A0A3L8DFU2_OOCBI|nr:hypothetical protein DMN91_009420 [Ooceraea biroi]